MISVTLRNRTGQKVTSEHIHRDGRIDFDKPAKKRSGKNKDGTSSKPSGSSSRSKNKKKRHGHSSGAGGGESSSAVAGWYPNRAEADLQNYTIYNPDIQ